MGFQASRQVKNQLHIIGNGCCEVKLGEKYET